MFIHSFSSVSGCTEFLLRDVVILINNSATNDLLISVLQNAIVEQSDREFFFLLFVVKVLNV